MLFKSVIAHGFLAGLAVALPAPQISTISDGQPQAETATQSAVLQISNGQPQASDPSAAVATCIRVLVLDYRESSPISLNTVLSS